MIFKSKLAIFAAAIAGAAGMSEFFAGAALNGSWSYRGGTPSKRHRAKPGESNKRYRGRFCRAGQRPSYKHPHALTARPAPNLLNDNAALRDRRVRSIMRHSDNALADLAMAVRQFAARPYLRKSEAKLEYAGTHGNVGPGLGKRQRSIIARRAASAQRSARADIAAARGRLASRGGP